MASVTISRTTPRREPRAVNGSRIFGMASPALAGLVLVGAWQSAAASGALPSSLPSPAALSRYLWDALGEGAFQAAVGSTMLSWLAGFAVSVAVGILLGLVAGSSRVIDRLLQPVVEFCRPIPSIVYLPLVILVAGTGRLSVVVLVAGGALWPVLLQTTAGVRDADPVLRDMTRAFGLNRWERLRHCTLPSAAPFIATGLRISATISLVVVITTELLGTGHGMGGVIATAYHTGSYVVLFGTSLATALIGVILDQTLGLLERRFLHWHSSYRPGGLS